MTVTGEPRRYDKKFLYSIEIAGLTVAHFQSCSELSFEVGVVEQHEAGLINVADQSPGKVKFPPIDLAIGATNDRELHDWAIQVIDAAANTGEPDDEYKKTMAIVQRERDGSEKKRYNLFKAWPFKYVAGDWDATAEENVIESMSITFIRWERQDAA